MFEFGPLPENNLFQFFDLEAPAGTKSFSVSDGMFLLVEPLSPGTHTIRFRVPNNGVSATYRITVTPNPGDFDLDGTLTALDIDQLSSHIRVGGSEGRFDLNSDSRIDSADRATWVHDLRKTYFGDSNLDGQFNSSDLITVFQAGHSVRMSLVTLFLKWCRTEGQIRSLHLPFLCLVRPIRCGGELNQSVERFLQAYAANRGRDLGFMLSHPVVA
jgi:hypothetical protein